ncbi:MAG: TonB-dependent receptor [Flavobacteriaceae bacterium]|nr:TonB-dependent receptor [Flavobacteriaceae bacterium]
MKNTTRCFTLCLVYLFTLTFSFAQSGTVTGTIMDGEFAEPMAFSNVIVKGTTTGTTSDFDGKYSLLLEPGTYTLVFSYVGYNTQEISNVIITSDKETVIDITLSANTLETVVITTSVKRNTENAVLNFQKKSVTLLDGLSAQSIKKTGAGNIAGAVKSVPGVSVQGGKYVYVRGLGDRYTKSILNGLDIPGLDPDRNTIPMDIFPTNIIDNVIILKSASAEYPADFTGGIVDIVTKDFPTKAEYSISLGADYNLSMHFNDKFLTYEGSATDMLGYDDGLRNRPIHRYQPIPATSENRVLLTTLTNRFQKQLKADQENSGLNFNFGFTAGNQYEIGNNKLGYQASVSYKNKSTFYENRIDGSYTKDENDTSAYALLGDRNTEGNEGIRETLLNTLAGITYKTEVSKYKFTFLHIQNGESSAGAYDDEIFEGGGGSGAISATKDALTYTQRAITSFAFNGNHQLGKDNGWKLKWAFSPSFSQVLDKDHRITPLRIQQSDVVGDVYTIDPSSVGSPTRIWRNLSEENWVSKFDIDKKYELFERSAKVIFGAGYTYKFRDFNTDTYIFAATDAAKIIANGDANNILATENIWTPETDEGAFLDSNSIFDPANSYEGEGHIASLYVSNEFNVSEAFKAVLGVRVEQFELYYSGVKDNVPVESEKTIDVLDIFPSANLIYALNDDMNLRSSYYRTTARPSFKEASTAQIADPITGRLFIGGLDNGEYDPIAPTYINNFDMRYEWFRESGQMIAISGFYKSFKDPIEIVFFKTAPRQLTVANLGNAKVYGIELEGRQKFGWLAKNLDNLQLNINVSLMNSVLDMSDDEYESRVLAARVGETINDTRELQGQSPLLVNVGLDYSNEDKGLRTGLFYNVQGKTLEVVGTGIIPDVYTKPFHSFNFTLNKSFGENKNSSIDFKVSNILGQKRESAYESYNAADRVFKLRDPGTAFSLGYSYKF